jgi:hypothetical protein
MEKIWTDLRVNELIGLFEKGKCVYGVTNISPAFFE